jgi:hypothetical protein
MISTSKRGQIAEHLFVVWAHRNNYDVYAPVIQNQEGHDLIVDFKDGKGYKKIQVKLAYINDTGNGNVYLQVKNGGNKSRGSKEYTYPKGAYDYLAVVHIDSNNIWIFPQEDVIDHRWLTHRYDDIPRRAKNKGVDWNRYHVGELT